MRRPIKKSRRHLAAALAPWVFRSTSVRCRMGDRLLQYGPPLPPAILAAREAAKSKSLGKMERTPAISRLVGPQRPDRDILTNSADDWICGRGDNDQSIGNDEIEEDEDIGPRLSESCEVVRSRVVTFAC